MMYYGRGGGSGPSGGTKTLQWYIRQFYASIIVHSLLYHNNKFILNSSTAIAEMACWGFCCTRNTLHSLDEASLQSLAESYSRADRGNRQDRIREWLNERSDQRNLGGFMKKIRLALYGDRVSENCTDFGTEYWLPRRSSQFDSCASDF